MSGGRPRTTIGTYGEIHVRARGARFVAETRYRVLDGRLRKVNATAAGRAAARTLLKERLLSRPGYGSAGRLTLASPFLDLVELCLADLELRDLTDGTRENYRDDLRVHVAPVFEHYTLDEITTGRVEWFLKSEARISHSRAKHSRTLLNSCSASRSAMTRSPTIRVEGTSPLKKPASQPRALTLEQINAIRAGAASWRTSPNGNTFSHSRWLRVGRVDLRPHSASDHSEIDHDQDPQHSKRQECHPAQSSPERG